MAIHEHWNIRSRAHSCAHTGKPFEEGEPFFTALTEEAKSGELVRRDYSADGWKDAGGAPDAFSSWRSVYESPKSREKPEAVEKETAEGLLRRLMEEDRPDTVNARYILALMLERKRILKPTGTRTSDDGTLLIYEHARSGEVYLLRDPELKLDRIQEVQEEVSALLAPPAEKPAEDKPAEQAPAPDPASDPEPADADAGEPQPEEATEPA